MSKRDPISWDEFEKVDIRVGKIIEIFDFPEAHKPAYKLKIDFGADIGIKNSSAQITATAKHDLLEQQVAAVVNFPAKKIGPFTSEVLTLGFADTDGQWAVVSPIREVPLGGKLQ
jgi:tRNA-binding protein